MQTGAPIDGTSVYRPPEYRFSPGYSVQMSESVVQVFDTKTEALSADEQRMSFALKAPGVGVVLSPNLDIELTFKVKAPGSMDFSQAIGPIFQQRDARDNAVAAAAEQTNTTLAGQIAAARMELGYTPKLAFGCGDAVFKNLSSYQLTVNGAAVSNHSQDLYKRSLDQCYLPESVFKSRYGMAGGAYQKYDCRPVSGEAYIARTGVTVVTNANPPVAQGAGDRLQFAYGADPKVVAYTGDSGIDSRVKGLLGQIVSVSEGADLDAGPSAIYTIKVRAPVSGCGVFSPLTPEDDCSAACPLRKSLMALCHMNNVQFDFLWSVDGLIKGIFRSLSAGSVAATGTNRAALVANSLQASAGKRFDIQLQGSTSADPPTLHARFLRLPSWRSIPDVITCSTFRNTVHKASSVSTTGGVAVPAGVIDGTSAIADCLPPVGVSLRANSRDAQQKVGDGKFAKAEWRSIQAAQVPQYLFFCMQKDSKLISHTIAAQAAQISSKDTWGAGAAPASAVAGDGQRAALRNYAYARNTDSNAAIVQFGLEIQASIGSYKYSSETTYPYLKTRQQLWKDHSKNCPPGYCSDEMDIWFKNNCCLLLHCSDWLRGLTTPNTAFPVQINAEIRFENRREFIDGAACSAEGGFGPAVLHDMISGTPCMVLCYPNTSLTVTSSSAAVSAANYSHSSGMDLLSSR